MSVTAPTRPTLLSIEQGDKPIRFTALGEGNRGIVSTIQPGNPDALQRAIDMVNTYGGPNMWRVEEVDTEPDPAAWPESAGYAHATRLSLA